MENKIADRGSRVLHENTEWSSAFDKFVRFLLFQILTPASQLNSRVGTYCSCDPDSGTVNIDDLLWIGLT